MPPVGIMLECSVSVWHWEWLSLNGSQEPSDVEMAAAIWSWCHPGCHSSATQEDLCIAFPSTSSSNATTACPNAILHRCPASSPGLQWPGTPHVSLVLCKAEELGFSMPKQHLSPRSSYPEIRSSAHSAKRAAGASKFQSNGSDLRITGDGCCREGGTGLQIQLLCWRLSWAGMAGICRDMQEWLLAESARVSKNIQVSLFHVSFSAEWLGLLM